MKNRPIRVSSLECVYNVPQTFYYRIIIWYFVPFQYMQKHSSSSSYPEYSLASGIQATSQTHFLSLLGVPVLWVTCAIVPGDSALVTFEIL